MISVDPSSPFSHGALLGDRIRLTEHFVDPGVFIRSMASRGHLGGVAGATADAVTLMDAFGFDVIVVETVGVGQSEIEIAEIADTIVVALQPGSGDTVQTLKAGILEIADVFVVNKRDHPMAMQLQREIRSMMEMRRVRRLGAEAGRDASDRGSQGSTHSGRRSSSTMPSCARPVRSRANGGPPTSTACGRWRLGALERRVDRVVAALPDGHDPYVAARDVVQGLTRLP